jgi:hypothetical protein
MPKITQKQIDALDKLLDSPSTLQKMGAALVHNMKDQLIAGKEIKEIVLPLTEAPKLDFASPVSDSIGVGVNDYVSVSWSKDIDKVMRDRINEKIKGTSKLQAARVVKQVMPKGLEAGKRIKLSR